MRQCRQYVYGRGGYIDGCFLGRAVIISSLSGSHTVERVTSGTCRSSKL